MEIVKLIFGILCIVLMVFFLFQSCIITYCEIMIGGNEHSGIMGLLAGFLMLAVGIIMIATRKGGKGGSIACLLVSALSMLLCFAYADQFTDLKIWGSWSLIIGVINIISLFC